MVKRRAFIVLLAVTVAGVAGAAAVGEKSATVNRRGDKRKAREADAVEGLPALLQRIREFHDVGEGAAESAEEELAAVLRHLRLEAINDELKLILESGDLSPEALARTGELLQLRNDLKATPAKT